MEHIAEALDYVSKAGASLSEVDLRTTSGELRELLKNARGVIREQQERLLEAMLADVPKPVPEPKRKAGSTRV